MKQPLQNAAAGKAADAVAVAVLAAVAAAGGAVRQLLMVGRPIPSFLCPTLPAFVATHTHFVEATTVSAAS